MIPRDLPPTTGPCPHCGGVITSPPPVVPPPLPPRMDTPQVSVPPALPPAIPQQVPAPDPPPPAPVKPVEKLQASDPPQANEKNQPSPVKATSRKSGLIPVMLVLLILILGAGVAMHFVTKEMGNKIAPPTTVKTPVESSIMEANYIRIGWQKDAYQILRDYVAASTSKAKLPFILDGERMATRLDDFYGGGEIIDSDTPAEAFSIYELSEEDRKRGLFMMVYDQPPQVEMKDFFLPLATLEVQYGIDEADILLSTLARFGNFAMEPLRVHAFFKRTPEGLKLDWEIFAQTKYRTLQSFVELPETGQTGVFRVFIVEDVPEKGRLEAGTRTYRVVDPANNGDSARVNVKLDSEIGRALSIINWRGTKESSPITRTATVELKWSGEPTSPQLEITRFICWEFLGLGGKESPSSASGK